MAAAHGDGSLSGEAHGECLQAIRHYFQQRSCRSCARPYTKEGIEFLRQEPGVVVVRVGCSACGQPLGIALVGMSSGSQTPAACQHGRPALRRVKSYPKDWTKRDARRLSGKPAITYDDVLAAHEFFNGLNSNWASLLPAQPPRGKEAR